MPVLRKEDEEPPPVRAARFRSARRVPAALTALVLLAVAALFLYDTAAVRAHRPGMHWRRSLTRTLAGHTLDDPGVVTAAAVLVALGVLLLVLAATPGLRAVLPMHAPDPAVRAGLTRKAAALVLRDRAMEVAGVRAVRVSVRRARVVVRAVSHFRELDEVRADLDDVLAVGLDELGLAHAPPVDVRVSRPAGKG
ncbi:DUF6286 domain-containing protein [Streptomyces sp. NPDC089919]|uniref:DUF6286 domain-containing protein n=1 Tax=Streptomyces sp. NPDC089919 TaxID=3155188 RepID=UPI00343E9B6C